MSRSVPSTPRKSPQELKNYGLLDELNDLAKVQPRSRFYTHEIILFSCGLLAIGLSAYLYVQHYLTLPNIRTVYRRQSEYLTIKPNMLLNISNVPEIINQYKDFLNETKNQTKNDFIIAVDALSTSPFVNIDKKRNITGLLPNDIIIQESYLLETSFDKFEKFIQSNSNKIINSLFVFALHPLNHELPTFFIHVYPSNNGKGNNFTTEILHILAYKCKQQNLNIIGFSSDGDNALSPYHQKNIERFEKFDFDITENFLYFSDVLHILKRGRYHFVKKLHKNDALHSKIDELRILFNLPYEIFSNASYTKMHESLAVRLFTSQNIIILYNKTLIDELIYFLPFVSLNEAVSNRQLSQSERIYMLDIIKYFCKYINKNNQIRLKQKYLIKPNIITDILSTVYSLKYLLTHFTGNIDLNRCSAAPLEHNFGIARMSCRDNNRMERLLLQFSRIDVR